MAFNDGSDAEALDLFQEPSDYYRPEKPHSFTTYTLKSGQKISVRLLGHSPLWGHLLWNAARIITAYLEENTERLVRGKTVLELGAGSGVPSLACAILGASTVVASDYPDPDLIENLRYNIDHCEILSRKDNVLACGYLWGASVESLTAGLTQPKAGFDLLILADILFNHSEHEKLVTTVQAALRKDSQSVALVFFTPYRPWLLDKDLHFFDLAREKGFIVSKILVHTMDKVMFENDPGDELLRKTVFGYEVKWNV